MQEKSVDFLRIDINSGQVRKSIAICQSDATMRTLSISLVDNGTVLDLSTCVFAEILIKKADDYEADNGCVIEGNSVEYTLRSTDISALGTNLAQIMLTFKDGSVITTPSFEIEVYSKVLNPNVQKSSNEYTSLTQQVAIATTQAENAAKSATQASGYKDDCNEILEDVKSASVTVTEAMTARDEAKTFALNAAESANQSQTYATSSKAAEILAETAQTAAESAQANAESAQTASEAAKALSQQYANDSLEYSQDASNYVAQANAEYTKAKTQAEASATSASASATSATSAQSSATNAATSETNAATSAAKAKEISEGLAGALKPMGTIVFASLPSVTSASAGDMYNISDSFTTTSDFVEGEGIECAAGSNVYLTSQNKWDVLAGQIVSGIKGNAETAYRKGNVNITAENLGLATVATSGSYEDLENKPDIPTSFEPSALGFGYATCDTSASLLDKVAVFEGYSIKTGGVVSVKFANAVNAASTLNVNGQGAKPIYKKGAAITANVIKAGDIATFMFDGTNYDYLCSDSRGVTTGDAYSSEDAAPINATSVGTWTEAKLSQLNENLNNYVKIVDGKPYYYDSTSSTWKELKIMSKPDFQNVLHTFTTDTSTKQTYTATEECWLCGEWVSTTSAFITVNGANQLFNPSDGVGLSYIQLPLQVGDVVTIPNANIHTTLSIFGDRS